MSGGALVFMVLAWAIVLSLNIWCFIRVLRTTRGTDRDA